MYVNAIATEPAPALEEQLHREGFQPGAPAHLSELARTIDEGVCAGSECSACLHPGLEYRPFHRGQSYRALAVCPVCQHRQEF